MRRFISIVSFVILTAALFLTAPSSLLDQLRAFAQQDYLEYITYYPSPWGEYKTLRVGNATTAGDFQVGAPVMHPAAGFIGYNGKARILGDLEIGDSNAIPLSPTESYSPDLIVHGAVGIGTTTPSQQLEITKNIELPDTTFANKSGIICKNGVRFIHNFNYGNNGTVTTDGHNIFIGENAGNFTMGSTATASDGSIVASRNTAVGYNTLRSNTLGSANSVLGYNSLISNTEGHYNTAMGAYALYSNTTAIDNTAIGDAALYSNTTGHHNTAIGGSSLYSNTTGIYNTANGFQAGNYIATGDYTPNKTSTNSLYLGASTKALASGDDNEIVIGYDATGIGSNSVVLGNDSITKTALKGSVGIGTTAPDSNAILDISSATKGFLPPRLTTAQRDAINGPPAGLMLYNSTTGKLNFYSGITSKWEEVASN